jgi:hypothetical protein
MPNLLLPIDKLSLSQLVLPEFVAKLSGFVLKALAPLALMPTSCELNTRLPDRVIVLPPLIAVPSKVTLSIIVFAFELTVRSPPLLAVID